MHGLVTPISNSLTWIDILSVISSVSSIVLAILAIWLSWLFFRHANDSSKDMEISVNRIGDATTTLSKLSMKLIGRLTSALVDNNQTQSSLLALTKSARESGLLTSTDDDDSPTKAQLEQFRIDNLIAALYYCGLSNITMQVQLPASIEETASATSLANLVDQSHADFNILHGWIINSKDFQKKIDASPIKHLYGNIDNIRSEVRSVRDFYATAEKAAPAA